MGVDKEELSSRFTRTFQGHFLKSEDTSLLTFKTELLSNCSSTVVYDIPFHSSESVLLHNVKNTISNFATYILLHKTESNRPVTFTCLPIQSLCGLPSDYASGLHLSYVLLSSSLMTNGMKLVLLLFLLDSGTFNLLCMMCMMCMMYVLSFV